MAAMKPSAGGLERPIDGYHLTLDTWKLPDDAPRPETEQIVRVTLPMYQGTCDLSGDDDE